MSLPTGSDNDVYTDIFDVKYVPGLTNTITISWKDNFLQGIAVVKPEWHYASFKDVVDELNEHDLRKREWVIAETTFGYTLKNVFYNDYFCGGYMSKTIVDSTCYWTFKPRK